MGKKPDFFQVAVRVGQQATRTAPPEEPKALPPKAAAGRKGGLKGGKARAEKLTPEEKHLIAVRAARARWADKKKD
jgi:hypothetical protein